MMSGFPFLRYFTGRRSFFKDLTPVCIRKKISYNFTGRAELRSCRFHNPPHELLPAITGFLSFSLLLYYDKSINRTGIKATGRIPDSAGKKDPLL
jgi:hypothetical protein